MTNFDDISKKSILFLKKDSQAHRLLKLGYIKQTIFFDNLFKIFI